MSGVRMTEKTAEGLYICKDCCHFHRYRLRSKNDWEKDVGEDEVAVSEDIDTYCRCLVGTERQLLDLTECIIVDCNQFERKGTKRKL